MIAGRNTRHTGVPVLKETKSNNKVNERSVLVMDAQVWNKQLYRVRGFKKLEHYKQFLKKEQIKPMHQITPDWVEICE